MHLEIESFYVFAKILIDRIADTFALYFLGRRFGEWGSSHVQLKRRLTSICRDKKMQVGKLPGMIQDLQTRVVIHRTEVIEHLREPRDSPGSSWGADGKIRISMGLASPTDAEREFDTQTTEAPADLLAALDNYIDVMVKFMQENVDKSVLKATASG